MTKVYVSVLCLSDGVVPSFSSTSCGLLCSAFCPKGAAVSLIVVQTNFLCPSTLGTVGRVLRPTGGESMALVLVNAHLDLGHTRRGERECRMRSPF